MTSLDGGIDDVIGNCIFNICLYCFIPCVCVSCIRCIFNPMYHASVVSRIRCIHTSVRCTNRHSRRSTDRCSMDKQRRMSVGTWPRRVGTWPLRADTWPHLMAIWRPCPSIPLAATWGSSAPSRRRCLARERPTSHPSWKVCVFLRVCSLSIFFTQPLFYTPI